MRQVDADTERERPSRRWRTRAKVRVAVALVALVVVAGMFRQPALRALGRLLVVTDPVQTADIAVMTSETGLDGNLELARLFADRTVPRVGILTPEPSRAARELRRRGVRIEDSPAILAKLGVPAEAIAVIPAGEGGTTEGIAALARWSASHGIRRVLVVTSATHSRRVRRTAARAFKDGRSIVLVHTSRTDSFNPSNWWRHRSSLRAGLVELQKLLLDYVRHPAG